MALMLDIAEHVVAVTLGSGRVRPRAPAIKITPSMVRAAVRASAEFQWDDGALRSMHSKERAP